MIYFSFYLMQRQVWFQWDSWYSEEQFSKWTCRAGNHNSFGEDDDGGDEQWESGDGEDEIGKGRKWEITGKSFDQKLLMRLWGV